VGSTDRVRKKTEQRARRKASAFVIAIGGISGAGKSVVVEKVAGMLGEAATFNYDHYPNEIPPDPYRWLKEGMDLNLIKTPQFTADLHALKHGEAVRPPNGGLVVHPAPFIAVEEPFARAREEVSGLIDLAVYIDVPFEIALARKWLREFSARAESLEERGEFSYESFAGFIYEEMFLYLLTRRDEYVSWHYQALKNCDLVLDGMKSVDALAEEVVEAARRESGVAVRGTDRRQRIALTADSSVGDILKSRPDAREVFARNAGIPVGESELAMATHMTLRQVAGFLGFGRDVTDALLNELNED